MSGKMLVGAVAVAVWYVIWDLFLFNPLFGPFLSQVQGIQEPSLWWVIVGDLTGALVLSWFYGKTGSAFGTGIMGGLKFGVAVGVVMGFPMWLMMSVYLAGWPYVASWPMVVANIVWVGVAGVVLAFVSGKTAGGAAAA